MNNQWYYNNQYPYVSETPQNQFPPSSVSQVPLGYSYLDQWNQNWTPTQGYGGIPVPYMPLGMNPYSVPPPNISNENYGYRYY